MAQHTHAPHTHTIHRHTLQAILLAFLGFSCWTVGDFFIRYLGLAQVPKHQMLFLSGFGGVLSIFLVTWLRGNIARLRPRRLKDLTLFGLSQPLNFLIITIGLQHVPLTDFYAITFGAPLAIAVGASWFFREKSHRQKTLAILAGFIGVLVAVNPQTLFTAVGSHIGTVAALISMVIVTAQALVMRYLGDKETTEACAFIPRLVTTIVGILSIIVIGWTPMEPRHIFCGLIGGLVGGMGWLSISTAYKLAPAATVAPFQYTQIITGAVLGYLMWADRPALHTIVGAVIIIAAGLSLVLHARRNSAVLEEPLGSK